MTRLCEYAQGGNREHIVDVANLIEIEWVWPQREGTWYDYGCEYLRECEQQATEYLRCYSRWLDRWWLVSAIDAVTREWNEPSHPKAHWEAQDTGGHWSLRNQGAP